MRQRSKQKVKMKLNLMDTGRGFETQGLKPIDSWHLAGI